MKRIKVTVTAIFTLSPGAELVESFVSDEEDLGPHIKVEGKLYCPFMEWSVFKPHMELAQAETQPVFVNAYQECGDDTMYEQYLAHEEPPVMDHAIEVLSS